MIKRLRFQGFKSWQDTGNISMGSLTGFFGTNSSGKTALLQFLLMLKQTVETTDRSRVLHTGDEHQYVDLGTLYDVVYGHEFPSKLEFEIDWSRGKDLRVADPEGQPRQDLFRTRKVSAKASVDCNETGAAVQSFLYTVSLPEHTYAFGMRRSANGGDQRQKRYQLVSRGYDIRRTRGRAWPLPAPVKCYGFPDQVNAYYQNAGFLSQLALSFEELHDSVFYLGPLREYPHRSYVWAGDRPQDVGQRGELAVPAILAARRERMLIGRGRGKRRQTLEERVGQWLSDLGMIDSFNLRQIAENRQEYEVRVKRSIEATEVSITDVGFGVSQLLPVLTLCYYAPEGSTIILEQPEIHLHPSVQAGLADVFIDAIHHRDVQIILESHSEHLLRRLQRRIAERVFSSDDAALYFVSVSQGASCLDKLDMDLFGNIRNWPKDFFGDEMADLVAQAQAQMRNEDPRS